MSNTVNNGLTINTIGTVQTCQPLQISWTWDNQDNTQSYSFSIINDVSFSGPSELASPVDEVLVSGVTNSTTSFTWMQVNVPPGTYQINAYDATSDLYVSNAFQVELGTEIACLGGIYAEGATTSPTSTAVPADAISSTSSGLSHGAIAGIVIGICAGVLAVLILFFVARRRRINRLSSIRSSRFAPYAFRTAGANGTNTRPPSNFVVKAPLPNQSPLDVASLSPNEYPPDKKFVPTTEAPFEKAFTHTRIASSSRAPPPSYDAAERNAWA